MSFAYKCINNFRKCKKNLNYSYYRRLILLMCPFNKNSRSSKRAT